MYRASTASIENVSTGRWTRQEHERFLKGIQLYLNGPWKLVAAIVKTRTARQLRTHAQKFRATLARRKQRQKVKQGIHCLAAVKLPKASPGKLIKKQRIEPIQFTDSATRYDECIAFLIDAFQDDLRPARRFEAFQVAPLHAPMTPPPFCCLI
ncbi:hypothetical protein LEN26_009085 [Aphanomyces euteiches]|nr:hypothetical protein AeMF1_008931 [Aphanomyces euteiches]KAH9128559.1 hypothetical protein LEN26_009085 [Aphanomyces euteiches]